MKKLIERIPGIVFFYRGLNRRRLIRKFKKDFERFRCLSSKSGSRLSVDWSDRYMCLYDRTATTDFDRHYVYHTAWAARVLAQIRPEFHIDISSLIYFTSLVSAFVPVKFYDFRPVDITLSNLTSDAVDLMNLSFEDNSIKSLSCMHVVEHVGLGRYGDPLDPVGDLKAVSELTRVLSPGGNLLFVVPVGMPKVMFNAHRIYSYAQVMGYFKDLELRQFALIPDRREDGELILNASEKMTDEQTYGCGCFWFIKKQVASL